MSPHLNSFQRWAGRYARPMGFSVTPKGNWVILERDGAVIECMTERGVMAACRAA